MRSESPKSKKLEVFSPPKSLLYERLGSLQQGLKPCDQPDLDLSEQELLLAQLLPEPISLKKTLRLQVLQLLQQAKDRPGSVATNDELETISMHALQDLSNEKLVQNIDLRVWGITDQGSSELKQLVAKQELKMFLATTFGLKDFNFVTQHRLIIYRLISILFAHPERYFSVKNFIETYHLNYSDVSQVVNILYKNGFLTLTEVSGVSGNEYQLNSVGAKFYELLKPLALDLNYTEIKDRVDEIRSFRFPQSVSNIANILEFLNTHQKVGRSEFINQLGKCGYNSLIFLEKNNYVDKSGDHINSVFKINKSGEELNTNLAFFYEIKSILTNQNNTKSNSLTRTIQIVEYLYTHSSSTVYPIAEHYALDSASFATAIKALCNSNILQRTKLNPGKIIKGTPPYTYSLLNSEDPDSPAYHVLQTLKEYRKVESWLLGEMEKWQENGYKMY